jgi:AraC-like DNA-binding protein
MAEFSTRGLAPEQRLDRWNDWISDSFTVLEATPHRDPRKFNNSLQKAELASLSMARVVSQPSRVEHTAGMVQLADEEVFLLHLQGQGRSQHRQAGREALLQAGDFTLCDSARAYSVDFTECNEMFVLRIPKTRMQQFIANADDLVGKAIDARQGVAAMTSAMFRSAWHDGALSGGDAHFQARLEENVLNMLPLVYGEQVKGTRVSNDPQQLRLAAVKRFIDDNLSNMDLNLDSIAAAQRISKRYLHKLFASENMTVRRYVQSQRLSLAKGLLADARYDAEPVEAIAFRCGFQSSSHFNRLFKSCFGLTPSQFRRQR